MQFAVQQHLPQRRDFASVHKLEPKFWEKGKHHNAQIKVTGRLEEWSDRWLLKSHTPVSTPAFKNRLDDHWKDLPDLPLKFNHDHPEDQESEEE